MLAFGKRTHACRCDRLALARDPLAASGLAADILHESAPGVGWRSVAAGRPETRAPHELAYQGVRQIHAAFCDALS
jgi:hypothetical protein